MVVTLVLVGIAFELEQPAVKNVMQRGERDARASVEEGTRGDDESDGVDRGSRIVQPRGREGGQAVQKRIAEANGTGTTPGGRDAIRRRRTVDWTEREAEAGWREGDARDGQAGVLKGGPGASSRSLGRPKSKPRSLAAWRKMGTVSFFLQTEISSNMSYYCLRTLLPLAAANR